MNAAKLSPRHGRPREFDIAERRRQDFDGQGRQRPARNWCKTQMPRLGPHPTAIAVVWQEKTVVLAVPRAPGAELFEYPARGIFQGNQLRALSCGQGGPIDQVDLCAPMVAARAR